MILEHAIKHHEDANTHITKREVQGYKHEAQSSIKKNNPITLKKGLGLEKLPILKYKATKPFYTSYVSINQVSV